MILKEFQRMAEVSSTHWWYQAKHTLIAQVFSRFISSSGILTRDAKLLDLGCGTGHNWALLRQFGEVTGVEQSKTAVDFCKKLGWKNVWYGSIQSYAFPKNHFSVVTIFDVLYHQKITSDVDVLKRAWQTLKPKGWLVVTDCIGPEWYGPHDVSNLARERYTLPELIEKITAAGFTVRHASHYYFSTWMLFVLTRWFEQLQKKNFDATEDLPPAWLNAVLSGVMRLEVWWAVRVKLPWGSSGLVVAQKN
jgi:SAM-dependent methyltransferase